MNLFSIKAVSLMKKKTFFLFLWLILPQVLLAKVNILVVHQTNGTKTMFLLDDAPVITYSGNMLILKTATKEASMPVASVKNVTFEDDSSIPTRINEAAITADGILFLQLAAGSEVRVYTVDGRAVSTLKADSSGVAALDLSALPKGVLIIRTPDTTIKVNN